jgi:peptidyl-prolyl cis-trans isomerase C
MRPAHTLPAVLAAALLAGAAVGAQPRRPDAGAADVARPPSPAEVARRAQVVARVNATSITLGELEDLLNEAPAPIRATYADPARRREFLQNLLTTYLLADEARRRGLDRDPQLAQTVRRNLGQRVEQVAVLDAITPEAVTDAEVRQWYEGHVADYQQPEYRRATILITADRAVAERAIEEIRRARGDMRRVRDLARQHSVDEASRAHDGDTHYFQRTGLPSAGDGQRLDPALAEAVFGLVREMDVTPAPVAVAGGRFGVAVFTGQRPALRRTLDDASVVASIRGFIVRERRIQGREELLRGLRARLRPEVHEERLDLIRASRVDIGTMPAYNPARGDAAVR